MINDPNKPIIDVRTSSLDGQEAPAYTGLTPGESLKAATPATENAKPVSIGTQSPQAGAAQSPSETSESSETASSSRSTLMTTVPDQFKGTTNDELIAYLEKKIAEHKPLTDEDVKKIRRRQRAEGIISGIADAAQSVANLFYTTQYAPNMYNADEGMSARAKARFEKEKAEREADDDRYFNYAMNLAKLKEADQQKGLNVWQLEQNMQYRASEEARKDAAEVRAQAKADHDEAMAELRMELMQGKIDAQEAASRAKDIEANYAEAYWQSRINKNNYRAPIRGSRGGNRSPGEYPWYDKDGKKYYAHSYEAMRQNAIDNGTWNEATQKSESKQIKSSNGKIKDVSITETERPAKGYSSI